MSAVRTIIKEFLNTIFPERTDEKTVRDFRDTDFATLPPPYEQLSDIHSLFSYKHNTVQALIWELKYHRNPQAIALSAKALAECILEELADATLFAHAVQIILVGIPISSGRLRERGFCQTDLLCKAMIPLLPNDIIYRPEALSKIRDTEKQSWTKNREARLKNLAGCFRADPRMVSGKQVVLIDDVTTTGATISEAVQTLTSAGAKGVLAFTIAH